MRFNDDKVGQQLRYDKRDLLRQHKPNDPLAVPIKKLKKTFRAQGSVNWMREQFPLTLCYAITAHKVGILISFLFLSQKFQCQGQTLEEVIIDFSAKKQNIQNGSFYTALTRVKKGCHFHLTDFKEEYIQANKEVEKKMKSMMIYAPHQFKQVYLDQELFKNPAAEMKVGYINVNGLYSAESCSMINNDFNLLQLDVLHIADTRLSRCQDDSQLENSLSNWSVVLREDSQDNKKHMGMLLLVSKSSKINVDPLTRKQWFKNYKGEQMVYVQVVKVQIARMKFGFVYIRETPNMAELQILLDEFRDSDCIMGDFNLDPAREEDRKKLQKLCGLGKRRILHEHTTTRSNQLDHIIIHSSISSKVFATSFINLTTDHRTISVRIPLNGNNFSEGFKRDWFFDKEKFTWRPLNAKDQKQVVDTIKFGLSNIDDYLDILKEVNKDIVIFNLHVMNDLAQLDFQDLDPSLKSLHILKAKFVIIPIRMRNIQSVAIWNELHKEIVFHFTQIPDRQDYEELLTIVVQDYIGNLCLSFSHEITNYNLDRTVSKVKPTDQEQEWIYLLSYLKGKLFEQNIENEDFDYVKHEKIMVTELRNKNAIQIAKPKQAPRVSKRKLKDQNEEDPKSKKRKVTIRYFSNPDQASCWINSCLQVVLTALDHLNPPSQNGSLLYNYLMFLQDSERTMPLDPTEIKNIIYLQEQRRIIEKRVSPIQRLFHFADTTATNEVDLCLEAMESQKQQDCRDFFECLLPNKEAWPDVVGLFEFSVTESIVCSSCGHISRQGTIDEVTFLRLQCPENATPLHEMILQTLSSFIPDWRCEDGCKKKTGGNHCLKVMDVSKLMFLTTIVNRLQQTRDGTLKINDTKYSVTQNVTITDFGGQSAVFSPIAVIYHTGSVTRGNDTCGHYRADVRSPVTNEWFQTSDDQVPFKVSSPSDQCYITIYKKIINQVQK